MSNLISKSNDGKYVPVSIKELSHAGSVAIRDLNTIAKTLDEIACGFILHVVGQQHYLEGKAGDTSALQKFLVDLHNTGNVAWAKSIMRFAKDCTGLVFRVHNDDDDAETPVPVCSVTKDDKFNKEVASKLAEGVTLKIEAALEKGIIRDREKYGKVKTAKRVSKASGQNGEVTTVEPVIKSAEDSGVMQALIDGGDNLSPEFLADLAEMITLYSKCPNRNQADEVFAKSMKHLRGALSLSAALKKAG